MMSMNGTDLRRFDLNLLLVFEVLLAERHVGRAAARLGITQSGASYALARLRTLTGDPLFVRNPKGVEPTIRALALADPIADILQRARATLAPHDAFDPSRSTRRFNLGATDYVTLIMLPPLLERFRITAPGIDLRIHNIDRDTITPLLDSGVIDAAIGISPDPRPKRFSLQPLFEDRLMCVARESHPAFAADRATMTPAEFAALPHLLITPRGDLAGPVDVALARHGLSRRIAVAIPHFLGAPFAIAASDVVAVVAERAIAHFIPTARIVAHPPPVDIEGWNIDLMRRTELATDAGLNWLCSEIETVAAAL